MRPVSPLSGLRFHTARAYKHRWTFRNGDFRGISKRVRSRQELDNSSPFQPALCKIRTTIHRPHGQQPPRPSHVHSPLTAGGQTVKVKWLWRTGGLNLRPHL
jgi:hypothetical protein